MNEDKKTRLATGAGFALAAALGWFTALVDAQNNEPQAAALALLLGNGLLGICLPRNAWRWAVVSGAGIFVSCIVGPALGMPQVSRPEPNMFATLLAIIPAMIGAYGGVVVRFVAGAFAGVLESKSNSMDGEGRPQP